MDVADYLVVMSIIAYLNQQSFLAERLLFRGRKRDSGLTLATVGEWKLLVCQVLGSFKSIFCWLCIC